MVIEFSFFPEVGVGLDFFKLLFSNVLKDFEDLED